MGGRRTDAILVGVCSLVPACLAASHVGNVADAAHDLGVARVLGLDPQTWRAIDVLVGAVLAPFPVGTRAARAALGDAIVAAAAGIVVYALAKRLLGACAETRRLRLCVASIVAVAAVVSPPWQIEGAAVGGSVTGALLVLVPLALVAEDGSWPAFAFALGLAVGHEPLVATCAAAGCGTVLASSHARRASLARSWREERMRIVSAGAAGLAPIAVALLRVRAAGVSPAASLAAYWQGEGGLSSAGDPFSFVSGEVGLALGALAASGCALALLVPSARPLSLGLVAIVLAGFGSAWLGGPVGPTRFGAPVLAGFAATCALAGVSMQALVRAIAAAKVPLARASAAMVVVMELALPADLADESLARATPRSSGAAAIWDEAVWGTLPFRSVVLVTDPIVYARALAARASGDLRDDVTIVPTFLHDARAWRPMEGDPAMVPLWRDLELVGAPAEASLSSIASRRPLAMSYVPEWGKAVGKHLVPQALFDRFEPEPRGASDRRRAFEAFASVRKRLARVVAGDRELITAAAGLLRSRVRLLTDLSTDPDLAERASEDLRAFTPAE